MATYGKKAPGISRDALRRREEKIRLERDGETGKKTGRTALNSDDAAIKIYEPAARIRGGLLDGSVYYISDLEQRNRAAEAMGKQPPYRRTRAHCTLPWTGGVQGEIWEFVG